jgi:hypothetical protein
MPRPKGRSDRRRFHAPNDFAHKLVVRLVQFRARHTAPDSKHWTAKSSQFLFASWSKVLPSSCGDFG